MPLPAIKGLLDELLRVAGWPGRVTVGLVLNAPVTLIPVFSTTGVSLEDGPLVVGVEPADDGWLDEGLDPADGEREPDRRRAH